MANYPLIFTRQLKEALGMDSNYSEQDTRLKLAIGTASVTIENLLGRKLSQTVNEEYVATKKNVLRGYDIYGVSQTGYTGTYKNVPLYLKNFPVMEDEPFEVYYDPAERHDESTKLDPSEYILDAERGVLIMKRAVGEFKRGLKVVYTSGFEPTVDIDGGIVEDSTQVQEKSVSNNLPVDIQQAAIWQAQMVYEKQYSGNLNMRESRGEGSSNSARYVNIHGVAPEVLAIVAQNKRPRYYVV